MSLPVIIDPLAPGAEVLGTALIGDRSHRPGWDLVFGVHRDSDGPHRIGFGMLVSEFQVTPRSVDRTEPMILKPLETDSSGAVQSTRSVLKSDAGS